MRNIARESSEGKQQRKNKRNKKKVNIKEIKEKIKVKLISKAITPYGPQQRVLINLFIKAIWS